MLNDLPEKHSKHDAPKRMVTSSADQQSKIDTLLYSPSAPTSEAEAENMHVGVTLPATGQRKGSHIFFVLRVSKDEKRIQTFDTSNGYPLDKHTGDTVMDPLGKEGIYDGISLTTAPPGNVFCGMGVLPEAPVALDVMAAHLRRARPIGLMRLVIAERRPGPELSDRHVLFVSKLMRMYDDNDQNFWVSKGAWSLRNTPAFEGERAAERPSYLRDEAASAPWPAPPAEPAPGALRNLHGTAEMSRFVPRPAMPFQELDPAREPGKKR
ncbi:hypothetical protein WME90_01360 [Sorangium sp. So ce375]|uniref:hypothetical protein n=1 Tax=Sorangium sp. So ce375 TaxID=3133306 RepID=UPI003F5BF64B